MQENKILKSLVKGYYLIAVVGSILTLLLLLFYVFFCYDNFKKQSYLTKTEILKNVVEEIEDLFKEDEALLKYLGDVIVKNHKYSNINEISNLLTSTGDLNLKSLTSSYVSWANDEGLITVSGKAGILKDSKKSILSRTYYKTAREQPWTLKLSGTSKSIFSSKLVLPSAMGLTNIKGTFIGYLVLGINISELERYLRSRFLKNGYHFLLLENVSGNILLASDETLSAQFDSLKSNVKYEGFTHNGNEYDMKEVLKNFNLAVFVGHNKKLYFYAFFQELFPQLIEVSLFVFFLVFLLGFFKNKIITPINFLSESTEKILNKEDDIKFLNIGISEIDKLSSGLALLQQYIKQNTQRSDLLNYTNHLTELSSNERENYYKGVVEKVRESLSDVSLCLNLVTTEHENIGAEATLKLINHTSELVEKAKDLFTTGKKSFFHINSLLDECVSFYLKEIHQHSINLEKVYNINLPLFYGDRFQLKHILICIINCILKEKNVQNSQIILRTDYQNSQTHENIFIYIEVVSIFNASDSLNDDYLPLEELSREVHMTMSNNFIEENIELIKRRAQKEGYQLEISNRPENTKEWVIKLLVSEPYSENEEAKQGQNIVRFKSYQVR